QKRKDKICPFSSLADFNPLQLTKSPKTLHIAPKELLTLSQAQNPQSIDRGFLFIIQKLD
ncbi:hypothetical protein, partial [Streptococcus pneumoniae]|uniref:hypothetical protein n=1 Tax=Streptococcus pneumoniae TaxID=1313 RepID=UPI001263D977